MLEILLQVGQHQLKQIYRRLPRPSELVKQIITYLGVTDPGPPGCSFRSASALSVYVGEYLIRRFLFKTVDILLKIWASFISKSGQHVSNCFENCEIELLTL